MRSHAVTYTPVAGSRPCVPAVTGGDVSPTLTDAPQGTDSLSILWTPGEGGAPGAGSPHTDSLLKERFAELARQWKQAAGPSSSVRALILHPAYLQIIGLGPPAVPLILGELYREPGHWFAALFSITGEDAAAGIETFADAVAAWLEWGRAHGYLGHCGEGAADQLLGKPLGGRRADE